MLHQKTESPQLVHRSAWEYETISWEKNNRCGAGSPADATLDASSGRRALRGAGIGVSTSFGRSKTKGRVGFSAESRVDKDQDGQRTVPCAGYTS
jgi:hypothetical protein